MPKTFTLPLRLTAEGTFETTSDPKRVIEQQILDLLCTNWGERVMRPEHGADLEDFLFSPVVDAFMAPKAAEIKNVLNSSIGYGEVVEVMMSAEESSFSSVRVSVYYRLYEGG